MNRTIVGIMVLALSLVFSRTSSAEEIYIDVGNTSTYADNHQTTPVDRYWNVVVPTTGASIANLIDKSNNATTVGLVVDDGFSDPVAGGKTSSALVDWGDPVTGDGWWLNATVGDSNGTIRITGLESGERYALTLYGGRGSNYTPDREMSVTIDINGDTAGGGTTQNYNSDMEGMVTFAEVSPDGSGEITVEFLCVNQFAHLNGMSIKRLQPLSTEAYIDVGNTSTYADNHQTTPVDRYWNVVVPTTGASIAGLIDKSNNETTVGLVVDDGFSDPVAGGKTSSALVDWGDPVTDDGWWLNATVGDSNGTIRITGLDPDERYAMTIYGARVNAGRTMSVAIDINGDAVGGSTTNTYSSSPEGMVTFPNVSPTSSGEITVDFLSITDFAHLNGISIKRLQPLSTEAYIDVGNASTYTDNHQTTPVDRYWNVVVPTTGASIANLIDKSNNATTVGLVVDDGFSDPVAGGKTSSALVDWGDPVTGDGWWLNATVGDSNGTIRITGLESGERYALTLYGGRGSNYTPDREMSVTIDINGDTAGGGTTQNYNSDMEGMVTFAEVSPDGSGEITVEFLCVNQFAHLNGMSITHLPPPKGTVILLR